MIINMLINEFLIISNIFIYFYSNETLIAIFSIQCIKRKVPLRSANTYDVRVKRWGRGMPKVDKSGLLGRRGLLKFRRPLK
jgi:hypothetical protein